MGVGGPLPRVELEEVVCVALVEVVASRGCKLASVVCVVVLASVGGVESGGGGGPLPKVVLDEVVCVALVVVVVSRGRKVASVVCTAVLVVVE